MIENASLSSTLGVGQLRYNIYHLQEYLVVNFKTENGFLGSIQSQFNSFPVIIGFRI